MRMIVWNNVCNVLFSSSVCKVYSVTVDAVKRLNLQSSQDHGMEGEGDRL